jgi:hypothetical protein
MIKDIIIYLSERESHAQHQGGGGEESNLPPLLACRAEKSTVSSTGRVLPNVMISAPSRRRQGSHLSLRLQAAPFRLCDVGGEVAAPWASLI